MIAGGASPHDSRGAAPGRHRNSASAQNVVIFAVVALSICFAPHPLYSTKEMPK